MWKRITTKRDFLNEAIDELRKLPSSKEMGNIPSIYKVIKHGDIDSYVKSGMIRQLAGGEDGRNDVYGEGVYAHITLDSAIRLSHRESYYGDTVLEMKLLGGYEGFVMYGGSRNIDDLIIKTYGRKMSVEEQLYVITKDYAFAKKWARYDPRSFGNAQKSLRREGYNIRGMVYEWGPYYAVLPFVFSDAIPFATARVWNDTNTGNIQFKTVYNDKQNKEIAGNFDPIAQLDMINAEYSRASVVRVAIDDNLYCVIKSNKTGGYNIVKIDEDNVINPRPKYIIPKNIYLSERPTAPDTENGQFMFSYMGINFYGTVCHEVARIPAFWNEIENDWCEFKDLENCVKQMRGGDGTKVAESLNEEITDLTKEDFLNGKKRIVYVCAHTSDVDAIFKNGFSRQFANNNDYMHNGGALTYGDGQYGSVSLDNAANNLSRKTDYGKSDGKKYGSVIIKCVLMGSFYNFLIFDEDLAKYIYKDKWQIMDQIDHIVKDPAARNELKNFVRPYLGRALYNPSQDPMSRTNHVLFSMFSSQNGFRKWTNFFRQNGIRGGVYHGHGDGYCFVCYNYSDVIPVAYSTDYGKSWKDDKFDFDAAKERSFKDPDAASRFGHKFKGMDSATPVLVNCGGKKFSVTVVQTLNGKYNILNNHTGDKVSPIDFDERPTISTEGEFQFLVGGRMFYGIYNHELAQIPAFWDPNENDWFPFNELKEHI